MLGLSFAAVAMAHPVASTRCEPVRAVTYNIRLDTPADGENRWERRRAFSVGQIQLLRPDVMGLQEVVDGQLQDLRQALPDYRFVGVARDDGRTKGEYSPLAIDRRRFSILASGTYWLSPTPEKPSKGWDAAFPRVATWARLKVGTSGASMLVVNTHFDHEGVVARRESARQVRRWIGANRRAGELIVMLGDLNSVPEDEAIKTLTGKRSTLLLRDSRLSSQSAPIGPIGTFNAFQARPMDSKRIDYVLVDPRLKVERYAVLDWSTNDRLASDHFPVIADLSDPRCGQRHR